MSTNREGFDPGWGLYGSDDDIETTTSSRRGRVGLHRPSAHWKPHEFWPGYRQAWRTVEEQLLTVAPSLGVGVPDDWEIRALRECAASGRVCEGAIRMIPGRPKQCYANVAHTYWADPTFQIWIGFGLLKEVWHEHCWGLTDEGVIIETTLSWDAYFGVPVPEDEAKEVAWELIEGEHPRRRMSVAK